MELTKENIIRMLAERCDFSLGDVRLIIDELINIFEESIRSKTRLNIRGLGSLNYFDIKARKGNKLVGENLPAGTKIVFSLAKNLKAALKENNDSYNESE